MTPEQLSALTAIATILKTVGSAPFGFILAVVVIGPWICLFVAWGVSARRTDKSIAAQKERIDKSTEEFRAHVDALVKSQEKRFEAVVRMYESNVEVVKNYHRLSEDLTGIITLSTRTLEGLVQKIDNNQFCPFVRKESGK